MHFLISNISVHFVRKMLLMEITEKLSVPGHKKVSLLLFAHVHVFHNWLHSFFAFQKDTKKGSCTLAQQLFELNDNAHTLMLQCSTESGATLIGFAGIWCYNALGRLGHSMTKKNSTRDTLNIFVTPNSMASCSRWC